MIKPFFEALTDGFTHITQISDHEFLQYLRSEGVAVDDEGIWQYSFGEHKEYDFILEPLEEEGEYLIALYKNHVLLIPKLYICAKKKQL